MPQVPAEAQALLVLALAWLALAAAAYLVDRSAVRYFVAIYWRSTRLVSLLKAFTERLSFIPLRLYLAAAVILFALPSFLFIPFIRTDGSVAVLPGFLYLLIQGTFNAARALMQGSTVEAAAASSAGVTPVVPGLTLPLEQLPYFALAVFVGVVAHEAMHGYAALRYGIPVKSVGVFSVLALISGAFVEPDEERFKQSSTSAKVAVLASGVAANVALAVVAMLVALVGAHAGLVGAQLSEGALGIEAGQVVTAVEGCGMYIPTYSPQALLQALNVMAGNGPLIGVEARGCGPDEVVTLRLAGGGARQLNASALMGGAKLTALITNGSLYLGGVRPGDVVERVEACGVGGRVLSGGQFLQLLLQMREACRPGDNATVVVWRNGTRLTLNVRLVGGDSVFFGVSPAYIAKIGEGWGPVSQEDLQNTAFAKVCIWMVIVNLGLAMVNALPVYPLDGGQLVAALLSRRLGERRAQLAVVAVAVVLGGLLAFNMALGVAGGLHRVFELLR